MIVNNKLAKKKFLLTLNQITIKWNEFGDSPSSCDGTKLKSGIWVCCWILIYQEEFGDTFGVNLKSLQELNHKRFLFRGTLQWKWHWRLFYRIGFHVERYIRILCLCIIRTFKGNRVTHSSIHNVVSSEINKIRESRTPKWPRTDVTGSRDFVMHI